MGFSGCMTYVKIIQEIRKNRTYRVASSTKTLDTPNTTSSKLGTKYHAVNGGYGGLSAPRSRHFQGGDLMDG